MNLYLKMMRIVIFLSVLFCLGCQENNFSDAALEEFFVLDRSIAANNNMVEHSINVSRAEIEENAYVKTQYLPLVGKINEIKTISSDFHTYIYKLRERLVIESGGFYSEKEAKKQGRLELEGRPIGQNDKNTPHQIFISGYDDNKGNKEPRGSVLRKKILVLRNTYIDIIAKMWDNGGIKGTIFADSSKKTACVEELKAEMGLNGIDRYNPETHGNKTWAEFTFGNMPVAAIYPILRKLQNDAILLEAVVVNFLNRQSSGVVVCGGSYPFVSAYSSKPAVCLGETYEAQITLAEQIQDAFTISINNQNIKLKDGIATYKTKPTSIGTKKYTTKIALKNPLTGETQTFTKDFHYEVHQPFVNISSDKMNLFYTGIDNPITIAAVGIAPSNVTVSIAGGTLTRKSNSSYIVNVDDPGNVTITVKDNKNGQIFPLEFRAKRLPDPVVRLGQKTDGVMGSGEFKAQPGIIASLENIDIHGRCTIESYTLYHTTKGEGINEIQGEGNRFEGKVADAIALAKPGDQYVFVDIKARCPGDEIGRRVNCLAFKIK